MSVQPVMVDLTRTFSSITSSPYSLGQLFVAADGSQYQFCKGGATIAQYEYVTISKDNNFTAGACQTTSVASGAVINGGCVQVSGGLTSSLYGWVFIGFGRHTGLYAASCVQDVKIFPTATQGVLDDSAANSCASGVSLITTITGASSALAWAAGRIFFDGRTA